MHTGDVEIFTQHTQKEEERFWEIDFIVDDALERMGSLVMTITGDTLTSNSEE